MCGVGIPVTALLAGVQREWRLVTGQVSDFDAALAVGSFMYWADRFDHYVGHRGLSN